MGTIDEVDEQEEESTIDKEREEELARLKTRLMFTVKRRQEIISNQIFERRVALHRNVRHRRFLYHKYERMQKVRYGLRLTSLLLQSDGSGVHLAVVVSHVLLCAFSHSRPFC